MGDDVGILDGEEMLLVRRKLKDRETQRRGNESKPVETSFDEASVRKPVPIVLPLDHGHTGNFRASASSARFLNENENRSAWTCWRSIV